jgi:CubicO group peptidase (beta-lactamase class C family)
MATLKVANANQHVKCPLVLLSILFSCYGLVGFAPSQIFAAENTAAEYPHYLESIGTVRQVYDGRLMPDIQINTFRNIQRLFPTRIVKSGPAATNFPRADKSLEDFTFTESNRVYDIFDVLALNRVAAMMVVKDDTVVFERYFMGNTPQTRWMSMSLVKTVTVMLIGAAIQDGYIHDITDPITDYLPIFDNTAYANVSVEDIVAMTSGVDWNETYTDPNSDRRRMLEAQLGHEPGAILTLMGELAYHSAPGARWNYSTGETHIAGALVRAATGKWVADYLSEKLWMPLGMESDATWWLESESGLEVGGSGLSATLRDYTRFGQFLLKQGIVDGQQVVPDGFVKRAGTRTVIAGKTVNYGYGLWPLHGNTYAAIGIFGQYIFVDPDQKLVVTIWSAQPKPVNGHGIDEYAFLEAFSEYFSNQ